MKAQTWKSYVVWAFLLGLLSFVEGMYFHSYVLASAINGCVFAILIVWSKRT
jgi:hypothetical protein